MLQQDRHPDIVGHYGDSLRDAFRTHAGHILGFTQSEALARALIAQIDRFHTDFDTSDQQTLRAVILSELPTAWSVTKQYPNDQNLSLSLETARAIAKHVTNHIDRICTPPTNPLPSDCGSPPHHYGPDGRCEWCLAGEREAAIFEPAFCAVRAKRDPACRPADPLPTNTENARLVHDLRLHALDDCDGQYLPTHVANIAANRLAELSGIEPQSAIDARAAADTIAALTTALHDAIARPKGVVPASAEPFYNPPPPPSHTSIRP